VEARGVDDIRASRREREKVKLNHQFDFLRIQNPLSKGEMYISLENEVQVKSQNRCIVMK